MAIKVKYCLVGDQHLKHKFLDQGQALFDLVEDMGLPTIWLGDLLDTKEVIRGKCLNLALNCFKNSKLKHYILVGNHDYFNLECREHALEALKLLPNVTIVDAPFLLENMLMLPYIHDRVKLLKNLELHRDKGLTLIGHLEIESFDFGNGHLCTTGVSLKDLTGFERIISGHFHKYQESGNLTYLGTPFSQSFGEANQTKYIGMYDTETNEFKIAETPFPRHISVEFDCDDVSRQLPLNGATPDNFYRIILTGTQANIDKFPKHLFENLNVKWVSRPSDYVDNDVSIEDTVSNETQFVKWAVEVKGMGEQTVNLGLSILEACK